MSVLYFGGPGDTPAEAIEFSDEEELPLAPAPAAPFAPPPPPHAPLPPAPAAAAGGKPHRTYDQLIKQHENWDPLNPILSRLDAYGRFGISDARTYIVANKTNGNITLNFFSASRVGSGMGKTYNLFPSPSNQNNPRGYLSRMVDRWHEVWHAHKSDATYTEAILLIADDPTSHTNRNGPPLEDVFPRGRRLTDDEKLRVLRAFLHVPLPPNGGNDNSSVDYTPALRFRVTAALAYVDSVPAEVPWRVVWPHVRAIFQI